MWIACIINGRIAQQHTWSLQFFDKNQNCFIILKSITKLDFGFAMLILVYPNGNNDLNVLDHSLLVADLLIGVSTTLGLK